MAYSQNSLGPTSAIANVACCSALDNHGDERAGDRIDVEFTLGGRSAEQIEHGCPHCMCRAYVACRPKMFKGISGQIR